MRTSTRSPTRLGLTLSAALSLALAAGCKTPLSIGNASGGDGGGGSTASGSSTDSGGATASGGTTASGGAGEAPGHPFHQINCFMACSTSADCNGATPDDGPDNNECVQGACVWKGCTADAECSVYEQNGGPSWVCRMTTNLQVPGCTPSCTSAADCDQGNAAHDADNYACDGGACEYRGCNSDAECSDTYGASWGCVQFDGLPFKQCWNICTTTADCDLGSPPLDPDNFVCNEGICDYTTCHSDAECAATWPETVCFEGN